VSNTDLARRDFLRATGVAASAAAIAACVPVPAAPEDERNVGRREGTR
jgi:hypothetical protein